MSQNPTIVGELRGGNAELNKCEITIQGGVNPGETGFTLVTKGRPAGRRFVYWGVTESRGTMKKREGEKQNCGISECLLPRDSVAHGGGTRKRN